MNSSSPSPILELQWIRIPWDLRGHLSPWSPTSRVKLCLFPSPEHGEKPPIQVYGLEGRYATALYSAATKQNKLEQVEKELTRVRSLLKDPKLSSVVMNPHTKSSVKQKAVNDALAREKMSPITVNLMNLLAENGRLRYTPGIVSAFGKIMSAFRGEVVCTVTTAQPLDDASLSELKSVLNGFLAKGEVLKLETKVCILDLQINVTMCMLRVSVCLIFTKTKYFVESSCSVT
uniref:ATP synthase peripheral stalk subunit OSCP, mitochondrial n=1 Tax=Ficedula albicollis TaxID=59894 RepID=A0A803VFG3_FICAL